MPHTHCSRSLLRALQLATICLLLSMSNMAIAQNKKAAGKYFQEGQQAYAGGDYGAAIFKFAQAYEEDPNGIFLYMTSLAYLKSDNIDKALEFGKKAKLQAVDLDEDMRARNEARILAIESGMARRSSARSAGVDIADKIAKSVKITPPPSTQEPSTGIGGTGITGAVLAVSGIGLMVGSLYFNRQVKALCVERADGECKIPADRVDEARQSQIYGLVMVGTGAALTLVGGGLFVYSLGTRDTRATLQVVPTRQGGYTSLSLTF